MKKNRIIAAAAALTMMLPCFSASAETKMWNDGLYDVTKGIVTNENIPAVENSSASVMFNGDYIDFKSDFPINDNGRIKLPFRELLENIGATVSFDEAQSKVTAVRGNTTIEFMLGSDTIYINVGGTTSEFVMDTSIDVINGRTFVPVRFMAEAFGLSVGWDDIYNTVVITDIDSYVNTLMTNCSNYMKLGDISYGITNYQTNQKLNISLDISDAFSDTPTVSNLKLDMESETLADKDIISSFNVLNLTSAGLFDDTRPVDIQDLTFSFILNGNKLYISTNLVEELAKLNPNDAMLSAAAGIIKSSTWLEGDIDELLVEYAGLDKETAEMFVAMLTRPESFSNTMSLMFSAFDGNSSIEASAVKMQVDLMSKLFGNDMFHLYQNADGTYSFDYKLDTAVFNNLISEYSGGDSSADILSALGLKYDAVMTGNISDTQMVTNVSMVLSMDNEFMQIAFNISANSNTDIGVVDFTDFAFPERTTKLSTILSILEGF